MLSHQSLEVTNLKIPCDLLIEILDYAIVLWINFSCKAPSCFWFDYSMFAAHVSGEKDNECKVLRGIIELFGIQIVNHKVNCFLL